MTKHRFFLLSIFTFCLFAATHLYADTRKSVKTPPPAYPAIALKMKIEGTVKMDVTIEPNGSVADVKVVSGHQLLVSAAIEAVKKWRYEPGEGKSTQTVALDFTLPH